MNIIRKILELVGLKKNWTCLKGKELKLITGYNDWNYGCTTEYKLIEGKYITKNISEGTPGDDLYEVYTIFKPKTQQIKLLVWIKNKENKITRYLVILNKKYAKKIIIKE